MAVFRLTAVLSAMVLLQGSFVYVCQSCSPEGWWPTTLVDDILQAQSVVYGTVRDTYPDQRIDTAYTVELEVYCILKGPTTPLLINITGGGYTPGHCTSSEFVASGVYVVTAYVDSRADQEPLQLSVSGGQINATQENLNEIRKACGLNSVTRPEGSSTLIECPVSVPDCQSEPTPRKDRPEPKGEPVVDDESSYDAYEPGTAPKIRKEPDDKPPEASSAIVTVARTLMTAAVVALAVVGV